MDPITQGLLGAAVTQSVATKSCGRQIWIVGALAGMAADLDIFIRSTHDPLLFIVYHRQFTHALSFIPIGGIIVALFGMLFIKSLRKHWPMVIGASMLAYATHCLIDSATSYGTVLYWPFSYHRVAWDIISIIDPVFTSILFVGVFFAAKKIKAKPAIIALGVAALYLCFGAFQHHRALSVQEDLAASRNQTIERGRVLPNFASLYAWRSVYIADDKIFADKVKTPLFKASKSTKGISLSHFDQTQLPEFIQDKSSLLHDFERFNWFSDGYLAKSNEQPLTLIDLRYITAWNPPIALWGIEFPTSGNQAHIRWKRGAILVSE